MHTSLYYMRLLTLCFALFASTLFAQNTHFPARSAGWVTLGIDGGTAFQTGDVKIDFKGYGGGLTLAKNLAYRPGGLLSFDLRGRFLLTRSFGLDAKRSYGIQNNDWLNGTQSNANYLLDKQAPNDSSFVYQNFRNGMGELGLEGVFTLNRLRERTGLVVSLFGGLGIDLYRTKIDQLDALGQRYNYFSINEKNGNSQIKADLRNLRDADFETVVDETKVTWMPAVGIELGYQVTPRFVVGIAHKVTFSRTDLLDGQAWTNQNQPTGNNDLHHYTSLHLRWDLQRAQRTQPAAEPPQINILTPQTNPYISQSAYANLRARVLHVRNKADIFCYLNGVNQAFTLTETLLESNLNLRPGRNEVRIVASNTAGRDEATTVIIYEEKIEVPPTTRYAPEVRIVFPQRSPFTTNQDNISLVADVKYVQGSRNVQLKVNGVNAQFSFAENLEANVRLREGTNRIVVEANTPDGRASDEIEVIYRRETIPPVSQPSVDITAPIQGATTDQPEVLLRANFREVRNKEQVVVTLNGVAVRSFEFDAANQSLRATLRLREGNNEIQVEANTANGKASDAVAVVYRRVTIPPVSQPSVEITAPIQGATTDQPEVLLRANFREVRNKEQVVVTLNGVAVRSFEFDAANQSLRATLRLREGNNEIQVEANTANGKASDAVAVTYRKPAPQGPRPVVTFTQPRVSSETVFSAQYSAQAKVENVNRKEDITLIVNGLTNANFTFNPRNYVVLSDINLRKGDNSITLRARNDFGSAEASVTITLKDAPSPKPTVTITQPQLSTETTSTTPFGIKANIENVTRKADITLFLNGVAYPDFDFEPVRRQLIANLKLVKGENKVRITATNQVGSAEASVTINLKQVIEPTRKPEVKILEPVDGATVKQAAILLRASLKNVYNKEQLSLILNGKPQAVFTYDDKSNALRANLTLNEGQNNITVRANTPGGTAEHAIVVTYAAKVQLPLPKVAILQPLRTNVEVKQALFAFKANAVNINNKDQVKISLNGVALTAFEFIPKTGNIVFETLLSAGKNTLQITVTNTSGTAEASTVVLYTKAETIPAPKVKIISSSQPAANPFNPNEASTLVLAQVFNIDQRAQITIKLNEQPLSNYNFDVKTGNIDFVAKLKRGINTIEIKVQNANGVDSATTKVSFE